VRETVQRGEIALYCPKCGTQLPDEAIFCLKCGASLTAAQPKEAAVSTAPILAPFGATSLKCPNCGGPISPKFGEMVITCEYCGTGVTLENDGWKGVQKQTMLPLSFGEKDKVNAEIHSLMDKGLLHRHLQENSTLEEMNLALVPYWIFSVSARTSIVATDVAVEAGEIGAEAALLAVMMGGMGGGRRRGFGLAGPVMGGAMMGTMMGAGRGGARKTYELDNNYYFPIVALKALTAYQPKNYQFRLEDRTFFDVSKVPKDVKILNGDIGEEAANYQAKTLVAQLQSEKAHAQYHMIQQLQTDVDVAEAELLHAPIWFVRYDYKGKKIVLVIDGNSGNVINSIGL
jgi:hypothetical protein